MKDKDREIKSKEIKSKEIKSLLNKYGADHKRALRENKRLPYLYALAPLRENLLEWFEFSKGGSLLQIGADYGALTGLFLRRAGCVTVLDESEEQLEIVNLRYPEAENLTCLCADLEELAEKPEDKDSFAGYQYVVLAGLSRRPVDRQIEAAKRLLARGGTLIVAACNRFGMKYWAGALPDEVSVTKRELSGFLPGGYFYYPMPDYRLPSTIYSEKYLPKKGDLTDTLAVYDYPEYLLLDVGAAYDAVCEDGQFDNFANSFLVIWKKENGQA